MDKQRYILFYGMTMSAVLGFIIGGFYVLQSTLIELIWPGPTFRPVFNAVWLLIVGLLIYSAHFFLGGPLPKTLGRIRAELKQTGWSDYRHVLFQMVVPAIILTSGTSLGPEATLVSSTILYGLWLTDKVRYITQNYEAVRAQSWWRQAGILVAPHRYLVRRPITEKGKSLWTPLTIIWFAVGVLFFCLAFNIGQEPSLIIRLGQSSWQLTDLYWFIPLMLLGHLLGRVYLVLMIELRKIILGRVRQTWQLILLGGVAIYVASLCFPAIMFSGQHNFHLLAGAWQAKGTGFLVLRSILKLALLTICLNTGWLGGDIFPVLFASTAQGIALSQLLPQVDPIFLIGVFAISMGGTILESPVIAGRLMVILFLPLNLMGVGILATLVLIGVEKLRLRQKTGWPRYTR